MGSRHLLKKLAKDRTTEAGIYRYFENKHLLLTYNILVLELIEFQIIYQTKILRTLN
jgi:hypothetical protein